MAYKKTNDILFFFKVHFGKGKAVEDECRYRYHEKWAGGSCLCNNCVRMDGELK